jgi:hypothetical protein
VLQANEKGIEPKRPFRVVQIGANNGNDALHEAIARINEKYGKTLPIEVVLVEPTILNFLRCKRNYERNKRMDGVKAIFVNAAISTTLCTPEHTTTIYHPHWHVVRAWEAADRIRGVLAEGEEWKHKWLFELNSLDKKVLTAGHFKEQDVTGSQISCFSLKELLQKHTRGQPQPAVDELVDFMLIDVEGFDWEVRVACSSCPMSDVACSSITCSNERSVV